MKLYHAWLVSVLTIVSARSVVGQPVWPEKNQVQQEYDERLASAGSDEKRLGIVAELVNLADDRQSNGRPGYSDLWSDAGVRYVGLRSEVNAIYQFTKLALSGEDRTWRIYGFYWLGRIVDPSQGSVALPFYQQCITEMQGFEGMNAANVDLYAAMIQTAAACMSANGLRDAAIQARGMMDSERFDALRPNEEIAFGAFVESARDSFSLARTQQGVGLFDRAFTKYPGFGSADGRVVGLKMEAAAAGRRLPAAASDTLFVRGLLGVWDDRNLRKYPEIMDCGLTILTFYQMRSDTNYYSFASSARQWFLRNEAGWRRDVSASRFASAEQDYISIAMIVSTGLMVSREWQSVIAVCEDLLARPLSTPQRDSILGRVLAAHAHVP